MSWYSKQIAEGIRKFKYNLPELKTEEEGKRLISQLSNQVWHVHTEIDLKKQLVYVTTRQLNQPIVVAQFIESLGYEVLKVDAHQPKSKKGG